MGDVNAPSSVTQETEKNKQHKGKNKKDINMKINETT